MITERRLALREEERHYVGIAPKVKRREENRERKALSAAKIEKAIEKELLERLKSGVYGDKPLNVDEKIWKKVMGRVEDEDLDEEENDWDEEEESDEGEVEFVEDEDAEDEMVDMEDLEKWLGGSDTSDYSSDEDSDEDSSDEDSDEEENPSKRQKKSTQTRKRHPKVEIEYEQELNSNQQELAQ